MGFRIHAIKFAAAVEQDTCMLCNRYGLPDEAMDPEWKPSVGLLYPKSNIDAKENQLGKFNSNAQGDLLFTILIFLAASLKGECK